MTIGVSNRNKILKIPSQIYFLIGCLIIISLTFLLNINILGGFLLIGLSLYFTYFSPLITNRGKKQTYLVLSFLLVTFIFITKEIAARKIAFAYIPVIGFAMLAEMLYDNRKLSFVFCLSIACLGGLLSDGSLSISLIFLLSGITAIILVLKARRRSQILTAGMFAGSTQTALFWLAYAKTVSLEDIFANLFSGLISSITVAGILPFLENIFGITTNISLLELSDFNHPLLKKMILEAPGTYHHSLITGNLAEAAAESVGANSLLARIGAYYHDIGKLANAEYFMENQKSSHSKHSSLNPSISKMVIMNHIKEGTELAKKYKLKPAIVDFISQHHGTSLVYYFYRKALEEIEEDEKIQEEGFRYSGPKPTSKETAIVLLADSVEAASRVINDPQPAKIQEVVHKVINNKFIDGQLDDCDLTLKDLEKIADVFIHMLTGIYHGRIPYPESSKKENSHKKLNRPDAAYRQKQDREDNFEDS